MKTIEDDVRLVKITEFCRALPEVTRSSAGQHFDFRVRKKVFAYYLDNHHGDGIVSVCCKSELGENIDRANREPDRFYLPAYIGKQGWFGLRLDKGPVNWGEVENILKLSYCLAAPRKLASSIDM
jgi:predicted DNA-binding protein (MmcQ/YjbR family)